MIFMTIATTLTKRLGLRYPVIAAPLGRGATPQFLAALAREGSMGFVALMHMSEAEVRQMLSGYVAATRGGDRFGVNLTLIIDQTRRLDAALEAGCRIVSLWQGDPTRYARRAKDAGAVVFWTVSGPDEAARAADIGADFVVAQGREAGGHLVGQAPLMSLLPAVVDASGRCSHHSGWWDSGWTRPSRRTGAWRVWCLDGDALCRFGRERQPSWIQTKNHKSGFR
jgi:nitronate monooxygenase